MVLDPRRIARERCWWSCQVKVMFAVFHARLRCAQGVLNGWEVLQMLGCVDPLSELLKLGIGDGCESGNLVMKRSVASRDE